MKQDYITYIESLNKLVPGKVRYVTKKDSQQTIENPFSVDHLKYMLNTMYYHMDGWSESKIGRWIGFIQASLITNKLATMQECKQESIKLGQYHSDSSEIGYNNLIQLLIDTGANPIRYLDQVAKTQMSSILYVLELAKERYYSDLEAIIKFVLKFEIYKPIIGNEIYLLVIEHSYNMGSYRHIDKIDIIYGISECDTRDGKIIVGINSSNYMLRIQDTELNKIQQDIKNNIRQEYKYEIYSVQEDEKGDFDIIKLVTSTLC